MGSGTLRKHREAIDQELLRRRKRARNVPLSLFNSLHEQDCDVVEEYEGCVPSGFADVDFMIQDPLYLFRKRCTTHGGTSEEYGLLTWPEGVEVPGRR